MKTIKSMKTIKYFAMTAIAVAMLASCSDDDDVAPIEEEEVITDFYLTFTNQADSMDEVELIWEDVNEDEVIDATEINVTGTFKVDAVYNAEIGLFSGDENFLEEDILADQDGINAHFFVYNTDAGFTLERQDTANNIALRGDGNQIGVFTQWTAPSTAQTGTIRIRLFHESPEVSDDGGFGTAVGTDTDIDVEFNVSVE